MRRRKQHGALAADGAARPPLRASMPSEGDYTTQGSSASRLEGGADEQQQDVVHAADQEPAQALRGPRQSLVDLQEQEQEQGQPQEQQHKPPPQQQHADNGLIEALLADDMFELPQSSPWLSPRAMLQQLPAFALAQAPTSMQHWQLPSLATSTTAAVPEVQACHSQLQLLAATGVTFATSGPAASGATAPVPGPAGVGTTTYPHGVDVVPWLGSVQVGCVASEHRLLACRPLR